MGCSIIKLDALKMGIMFSLKFYIIYWIVLIIHITSLKECIVCCSLWKFSVELVFELKCKLSRLLLRHLAVYFITFKFHVDLLQKISLLIMSMPFIDVD